MASVQEYSSSMDIASASAIRAAEHQLFESGALDSLSLMDAVIERLHQAFRYGAPELSGLRPERVVVYAGKGNNAGDAVGLAARLGVPMVLRCACSPQELSPDTQAELERVSAPISVEMPVPAPRTLILDGMLGSGAAGPLREPYRALVEELNALRAACPESLCVAIDIPTGLGSESGEADVSTVRADVTCPIGCIKPGMLADGAEQYVGRLLPIPLPEVELSASSRWGLKGADSTSANAWDSWEWTGVADAALLHGWLPRREQSCFKNRAGRVAVVAGSIGMLGAAQLCAEAALRVGAGLVCLYCLPDVYPLLATRVAPEAMVRPVDSYADIEEPKAQSLLIGPGLGKIASTEAEALRRLAESFAGTVVLDADGLNLAAAAHWVPRPNWILTPHPGEMSRLFPGASAGRLDAVRAYLRQHDTVLLLKGARTIIADRLRLCYNTTGGPYMANGGQGDTLAGAIAGLAAQGLAPWYAATMGAWACGQAAAGAWAHQGFPPAILASSVSRRLGRALSSL